jgi:hypothetical protein
MAGIRGGFRNPLLTGVEIPAGTITSTMIATHLQSDNWNGTTVAAQDATAGWRIEKDTGNVGAQNVFLRGVIVATTGSLGNLTVTGELTGGTLTGALVRTSATGRKVSLGPTLVGAAPAVTWDNTSGSQISYIEADNSRVLWSTTGGHFIQLSPGVRVQIDSILVMGSEIRAASGAEGVPSYGFNSDPSSGMYLPTSSQVGFVAGSTERMRLRTDFLLTAGGATGTATLKVDGAGTVSLPAFTFGADPDTGLYRQGINSMSVATGGAERLRVDNNGVWIRTAGTTASASNMFLNSSNLIFKVTSSKRWKTAVRPWTRPDSVLELTPVTFRSKLAGDDSRKVHLGLLAEDVADRFPLAALFGEDKLPESINWNAITTGLLAEVKDLRTRLERLELSA